MRGGLTEKTNWNPIGSVAIWAKTTRSRGMFKASVTWCEVTVTVDGGRKMEVRKDGVYTKSSSCFCRLICARMLGTIVVNGIG